MLKLLLFSAAHLTALLSILTVTLHPPGHGELLTDSLVYLYGFFSIAHNRLLKQQFINRQNSFIVTLFKT